MAAPTIPDHHLPADLDRALLVGRVWRQAPQDGPCVVAVRGGRMFDITAVAPTMADLLERPDRVELARLAPGEPLGDVRDWLASSLAGGPARLLAPCDLQPVKAAGVTFAVSLLERLIEEEAGGDAGQAEAIRERLQGLIGSDLSRLRPGSAEAMALKEALVARGQWSQYLEVGIGRTPRSSPRRRPWPRSATAPASACCPNRAGTTPSPGGAGGGQPRPDRGRDAGQRRQPARRGRAQRAAADPRQGQQRLLRHRPLHPAVRRRFHPGQRARRRGGAAHRRARRLLAGRRESDEPDQPRPAGPGAPDPGRAPPVPGRLHAVPGHHVLAHAGPARAGQRLHPRDGRPRRDRLRPAGRAGQRGGRVHRHCSLGLRLAGAVCEPGAAGLLAGPPRAEVGARRRAIARAGVARMSRDGMRAAIGMAGTGARWAGQAWRRAGQQDNTRGRRPGSGQGRTRRVPVLASPYNPRSNPPRPPAGRGPCGKSPPRGSLHNPDTS